VHDIEYLDVEPPAGDEPTAAAAPGGGRRRPLAGRLRWATAFGALATFVIGAVAVVVHQPPVDASAALHAAQEFVGDTSSYRFEVHTTLRTSEGDPDGAGSDSTTRSVTKGVVADADHWQVVDQPSFDDVHVEVRRVGDHLYVATTGDPDQAGPPWEDSTVADLPSTDDLARALASEYEHAEDEASDEDDPSWRLQVVMASYLVPASEDPQAIERVVRAATDPAVEEHLADGGIRLRAQVEPLPEIAAVAKHPIPPLAVTLDLDDQDRPTAARFDVSVKGASESVAVAYSDWGGHLTVAAPADDQVDHTPWIHEEAIAALDRSLLVAPTRLPADLELVSADVYDDWSEDGAGCPSLDLTYDTKADHDELAAIDPEAGDAYDEAIAAQPALDVTLSPEGCGYAEQGFDEPFAGYPSDGLDHGVIDVAVGGIVVAISSDKIDRSVLEDLVRSLAPTTVDALAAAIPDWAHEDTFGYWASDSGSGGLGFDGAETIADI
jgi:hypothetical protein